jgi:hypothetical protein
VSVVTLGPRAATAPQLFFSRALGCAIRRNDFAIIGGIAMTRATTARLRLSLWALPVLVPFALDGQEDGAFDRTPRDCIVVTSIDDTEAIDDQNIIFRMRGNRVFRNHLPRRCPGLERENRIAYQTRGGRLCSIDTITVLEQSGIGFRNGFTCRLGEFVPLSPEEIEDFELREEGRGTQEVIESRSVELEEAEEAEDAETAEDVAPETEEDE